jgi:hypothetical protein
MDARACYNNTCPHSVGSACSWGSIADIATCKHRQAAPGPVGVCLNRGCVSQRDGKCFDDGSHFDPKRCTSRVRLCDATPAPVDVFQQECERLTRKLAAANEQIAKLEADVDEGDKAFATANAEVTRLRGLTETYAKAMGIGGGQ